MNQDAEEYIDTDDQFSCGVDLPMRPYLISFENQHEYLTENQHQWSDENDEVIDRFVFFMKMKCNSLYDTEANVRKKEQP